MNVIRSDVTKVLFATLNENQQDMVERFENAMTIMPKEASLDTALNELVDQNSNRADQPDLTLLDACLEKIVESQGVTLLTMTSKIKKGALWFLLEQVEQEGEEIETCLKICQVYVPKP